MGKVRFKGKQPKDVTSALKKASRKALKEVVPELDRQFTEEIQTVNPTTIIETIIEKNLKFKNNIKINIKGDKNRHLVIPLRPRLFERAIQNLIENAQNYAKKIYLGINSNKKFLIITIEDDGPGIPANARELAVKPFSRLDQSRNQNKHSGVGLGLAIVKHIIQRHQGELEIKSKVGHGSTFSALFPSKENI